MKRLKRYVFLAKDLQILTGKHAKTCERILKKMKNGARNISQKKAAAYLGFDFDEMIDILGLWA